MEKNILNSERAQAGTEVMLLIGLAVIIALVIGYYIKGIATQTYNKGQNIASNTAAP